MQEIAILQFPDADSKDEAVVIVRASKSHIAVALSLKTNGDLEVFLDTQNCRRLVAELQRAITFCESP